MTVFDKNSNNSNNRFKTLFKKTPIPTYAWKKVENDFILDDYNDAAMPITQNQIKNYLGIKASDLYQNQLEIIDDFNRCFNDRKSFNKDMKYTFQSTGEVKYLHITYGFVQPDLIIVHTEDITERKKVDDDLKESQEKLKELNEELEQKVNERTIKLQKSEEKYRNLSKEFELIFDIFPGLIFSKDDKNNFIHVNQNVVTSYNLDLQGKQKLLSKEDLEGKNLFDILPKDTAQAYWDDDLEVITSGLPKLNIEESWESEEGTNWISTSKIPFTDENGNGKGIIGISTNITERKKAELKLIESEKKYRLFVENFQGIAYQSNYLNFQPNFFHGAVEEITGYSTQDFIQGNVRWDKIIHPDDLPRFIQKGQELPTHINQAANIEYRIINKNGDLKWVVDTGQLIYNESGNLIIQGGVYDITARKKVEQKLKDSEEIFRNLLEGMNEAVYRMSLPDGNYEYFSPASQIVFGYENKSFLNKPTFIKEIIHPEFNDYFNEKWNDLINGIVPLYYEYKIIAPNGDTRWILQSNKGIYDNDGKIIAIEGICRNVTKEKQAEQKLIESEQQNRTIINTLGDPLHVIDKNYKIILINEALKQWAKNLNLNSNLIGKTPVEAWPFLPDMVIDEYRSIFNNGIPIMTFESSIINEREITTETRKIPIFENEKVTQVITLIRDITERKEAEQKLKDSEEQYRITVNSFADALHVVDRDLNIVLINPAIEKWLDDLGISKNVIGQNLLETFPFLPERVVNEYEQVFNSGKPLITEEINILNNQEITAEIRKIPINHEGEVSQVVTIIRDITERKKAEQELIKLNKLKSEFLRRTSHELKTPLVSIKGFSSLLLEIHKDKLDDYILAALDEINNGCVRLESLISDILKTAKLDTDNLQLNKLEEDLSFLIRSCIRELSGFSQLRNHSINLNLHDILITSFEKEQIHQVVSNLLNNAIKYTPPNGEIEVRSKIKNNFIVISIKDEGIGITKEERSQIFRQFGKIERYGQGWDIVSEGSGLGLYISKKIVELHGGEIWVESEGRNKGSTFSFSLPIISES